MREYRRGDESRIHRLPPSLPFSSPTHKALLLGRGPASTEKQVRQGAVTSKRFSRRAREPENRLQKSRGARSCTLLVGCIRDETNEQAKQVRSARSPRYSPPRRRSIVSLSPGSGAWHTHTHARASIETLEGLRRVRGSARARLTNTQSSWQYVRAG